MSGGGRRRDRSKQGRGRPRPADSEATEAGLVVASFGRRCLVEDTGEAPRKRHRCVPRGRSLRIVCGDHVRWQRPVGSARDGQVLSIEPRTNALERPNIRGVNEVLAANITRLVVVVAPAPAPDPFMVDRYLAQAELMGCTALIVRSKGDLPAPDDDGALERAFAEWRDAGYATLRAAISEPATIEALGHALRQDTSILVGQSGVGKSSLLNALVPDLELATGALSESSGEGRHTTTAAHLHHLPHGGEVIDSPGVRDYAPGRVGEAEVAKGFRDIRALAADCRFHNCLHMKEPDCAVRAAAAGDAPASLAPRRYESYRRLVRLMESLGRGHH